MMLLRLAPALIAMIALLLSACGGDESRPPATGSATPEVTATAAPTPPPGPAVTPTPTVTSVPSPPTAATVPTATTTPAPHAPAIEFKRGVESLGENVLLPVLRPQAFHILDPVALAEGMGITPPECSRLIFYLTWQVRSPYPPTDVRIEVRWITSGAADVVGEGPSGQASGGCGEFRVVNDSDVWTTVEIRYAIGELAG